MSFHVTGGTTSSTRQRRTLQSLMPRFDLCLLCLQCFDAVGWRARGKIIRSVLCSIVCNSCTQWIAHTYEQTNSSLDWVLSHWAHFTVLRFIFVYRMYYFVSDCVLHACVLCSIVIWWGEPGGFEAWSLGPLLPSVLWQCWLGHLTRKIRPRYDL